MSEEKKKSISSALDKMEAESAVRAGISRKVRIQEKHSIKKEIEQDKNQQTEREIEIRELKQYEFRSLTTQIILGLLISIIVVWNLSRNQRTTLIETSIIIVLCCGIVAAKKK